MLEVRLSARFHPTEDRNKIVAAIRSIFPDAKLEGESELSGTATSLETFAELLKRQRIRDAARQMLRRGRSDNSTSFRLNKQVAAVGKVSFSEEQHPLGDIEVTIIADDVQQVIDRVAPKTREESQR